MCCWACVSCHEPDIGECVTGTVVVVNDPWRESSGSVLTDEFGTPKEQVLPTISQATEPPGTDTSGNRVRGFRKELGRLADGALRLAFSGSDDRGGDRVRPVRPHVISSPAARSVGGPGRPGVSRVEMDTNEYTTTRR